MFAAHGVFLAKLELADLDVRGVRAQIQNVKPFGRDGRHIVVIEINDLFGMGNDGVGVAGQEILANAYADDEWRTASGADNDVRLVGTNHGNAVGADDFAQRIANRLGQRVGTVLGRDGAPRRPVIAAR